MFTCHYLSLTSFRKIDLDSSHLLLAELRHGLAAMPQLSSGRALRRLPLSARLRHNKDLSSLSVTARLAQAFGPLQT